MIFVQGEQNMKELKAYIQIADLQFKESIEQLLQSRFDHKVDFNWNQNIAQMVVYDCESFFYVLKQAILMMISDFSMSISALIVPKFDSLFLDYLNQVHNNVVTAYDLFLKNYASIKTKKDMQYLLKNIKKEYLETANAFLKCNMNACEAAKVLYLHRNSFNYRLNQFHYTSGMDIKDFDTAIFVKLLLSTYDF